MKNPYLISFVDFYMEITFLDSLFIQIKKKKLEIKEQFTFLLHKNNFLFTIKENIAFI